MPAVVAVPEDSSFSIHSSAWRETDFVGTDCSDNIISIHSLLRRETSEIIDASRTGRRISIHSLRMEGDAYDRDQLDDMDRFQSTPSAWRETICTG